MAAIAAVLRQNRFVTQCEDELQQAIASVLTSSSIGFSREKSLSREDRPDFLAGRVALEVKVDGSLTQVTRQVHRYVQSEDVDGVLVVTTKQRHRALPREMNRKPVRVLYLNPL